MRTFCLKFPDKATAHALLYGEEGAPLYENIADYNRTGIPTRMAMDDSGKEYFTWDKDGSYCADIAGLDEVPAELEPYVITPNQLYRKHKFLGEE